MNNGSISFVVHVLNEEKRLPLTLRQLKKICENSKIMSEIIVVDEGSVDNSVRIARKFADKIHLMEKTENFGKARNIGMCSCCSEIIVSMDPDVFVPNDTIEVLQQTFEDRKIVAATTNVYVYPWEEKTIEKKLHGIQNLWFRFLCKSRIFSMAKGEFQVFRKRAFDKIGGYNEKIATGEDGDIMLRIAKYGKVKFIKNFEVYESPARYRKFGYFKTYANWAIGSMKYFFGNPPRYYKRISH
ncbi:glycosyltransferase [archaeon]|nr:glycosyltransferase [archaeon]